MGAVLLRSGMVRSSAAHLAAFCGTLGASVARMNGRGGDNDGEEAEEEGGPWGEERGMREAEPHPPSQPSSR